MRKSEETKKNRILMPHHDMHAFQIRMSCAFKNFTMGLVFAEVEGGFGSFEEPVKFSP